LIILQAFAGVTVTCTRVIYWTKTSRQSYKITVYITAGVDTRFINTNWRLQNSAYIKYWIDSLHISVSNFLSLYMTSQFISTTVDKTRAADLYLIYKLEPKARVCISDTDRMRMFYLVLKKWPIFWVHRRSNFKNKHCLSREKQSWSLCKSGQIFIRFTNID
jgi:hypothetical protein